MTTFVVGSFKYGSRHRKIQTARAHAYGLVDVHRPHFTAYVTITKLTPEGKMERWNSWVVARIEKNPAIAVKYDKQKIVGKWILRKDGSLGRKIE